MTALYGVYYWGIPAIIDLPNNIDLIEQTVLKKSGYKMAYILSTKRDPVDPLYTIRRIIVSGTWSTQGMIKSIESSFK